VASDIESAQTQRKVFSLILELAASGSSLPSQQVVAEMIGSRSKTYIGYALNQLREKGFIDFETSPKGGYIKMRTVRLAKMAAARPVPLLGRIAAGKPILANGEEIREFLPVPAQYVRGSQVFMLEVKGDSMIGDGILDGDYVLVSSNDEIGEGDICAVLIENDEATVKHVYREKNSVRLMSSNDSVGPIIITDGQAIDIQGKVIGVMRYLYK
jgi:repressor LexA